MQARRHGFSLVDLIAVLVIAVLMVAIVSCGSLSRAREIANRAVCGANIRGMYQAMYTYSVTNSDNFPVAGIASTESQVQGFVDNRIRGAATVSIGDPLMTNNITASLWMMIRDGSENPKAFICPSSGDAKDSLTVGGTPMAINTTWDFFSRENLSYSTLNMYHAAYQPKPGSRTLMHWSSNVSGDFVVVGDSNNADGSPDVHTLPDTAPIRAIQSNENSTNHESEGQNLLYGDGHVSFNDGPYEGPDDDNVYAMTVGSAGASPRLGNQDGDLMTDAKVRDVDVVLIPLNGNNGVSLSGLPGRGGSGGMLAGDPVAAILVLVVAGMLLIGVVVIIAIFAARKKKAAADGPPPLPPTGAM